MKLNENVMIKGEKTTLVPYETHHVPKYHSWMQNEELQVLTASEPLSIEQEYEMQKSWRDDEKKCTFIVLQNEGLIDPVQHEIECMIGDVNIFFNEEEDEHSGEIEIMIAEHKARGKGCGKEALLMMMRYGIENLQMKRFTAKIGMGNKPSSGMFNSIGFKEISRSDVFKEITLDLEVDENFEKLVYVKTKNYKVMKYR